MKFQGYYFGGIGSTRAASNQRQEDSELTRVAAVGVGRKGGGRERKEEIQDFTHTKERLTGLVIGGGWRGSNQSWISTRFQAGDWTSNLRDWCLS